MLLADTIVVMCFKLKLDRDDFIGNIAAPLAVSTKKEQRAVIRFFSSQIGSGAKSNRRPLTQYDDSAQQGRSVHGSIEKFKSIRTSEERAELPSASTTDEQIQQCWEILMSNRRVIIDEAARSLHIRITSLRSCLAHAANVAVMFTM